MTIATTQEGAVVTELGAVHTDSIVCSQNERTTNPVIITLPQQFEIRPLNGVWAAMSAIVGVVGSTPVEYEWRQVTRLPVGSNNQVAAHVEYGGLEFVDSTAPAQVLNLSALAGNASASLSWDAPSDNVGVTGYDIEHSSASDFAVAVGTTSSITSKNISGLTNDQIRYFRVRAKDAEGNTGPWSATASCTPTGVNQAPNAFTPTVSVIKSNGATVSFSTTDPESNPLTYKLVINTSATPPADWSSINQATSPYVSTSLLPNTSYYAHVQASDGNLTTVGTSAQFTTPGVSAYISFEEGTDGAALPTADWASIGSPTVFAYSSANKYAGNLCGKMTAPAGVTAYAECKPTSGMTANTAELEFTLYLPDTTHFRQILGSSQSFWFALSAAGNIEVITSRSATGYATDSWTQVGVYSAGHNRFKIRFNFTNDTFQLWRWNGSSYSALKADGAPTYDIPMKVTTNVTQSDKLRFTCYDGDSIWFDEIRANNAGVA